MSENTLFENQNQQAEPQTPAIEVEKNPNLPLIPLRNVVMFPSVDTSLFFGRKESSRALTASFDNHNRMVIITAQINSEVEKPQMDDIYKVGVLCKIEHVLQTDGSMHAIVRGYTRVKILSFLQEDPYIQVEYQEIAIPEETLSETSKHADQLLSQLKLAFSKGKQMELPVMLQLQTGVSSSDLADQVIFAVDGKVPEKQALLEELSVSKRLNAAVLMLKREMQTTELENDIDKKTNEKFNTNMKRNVLEERKRQIEKELKKINNGQSEGELSELEKAIKKTEFPKEVKKKVDKEYSRLEEMGPHAPEASYVRTWLEVMTELPWGKYTKDNLDIKAAHKILDDDHYGLKDVKERILEHLAVLKLKSEQKDDSQKNTVNILCFIGPPGVGKTSLGKSIAKALNREFVRISLGGVRDEAEIRGHRRTYVGAMPGRIIKGLKEAKSMNPVFMLDEVDKLTNDFRGDPSAALLEVLDPEQNKTFLDHYLDVHMDLSKVFFVLTGNDIAGLPMALRDRVEIIDFSGYTQEEKFHIAKDYLVKRQHEANGLVSQKIETIKDETLRFIIDKYTRESGVRNLERVLGKLFRKVAKSLVESQKTPDINDQKIVKDLLGPERYTSMIKNAKDEVGVATGMFWSPVGGDILFVEVTAMPGKGTITRTGRIGETMKESCQIALSYVRARAKDFGIKTDFHKTDIHIHFPEGAQPKDGPSAGIAITTALISALTGKVVKKDIAMTGEITIRGNVLAIGGLKEKTTGAHRAGITQIIVPDENKKDMVEIPDQVKKDVTFHHAKVYDDVYKIMFGK